MVQREVADRFFAVAGHEGLRRGLGARAARDRAHRVPSRLARGVPPAAERRVGARRVPPRSRRASTPASSGSSRPRSPTGERRSRTRSRSPGVASRERAAAALEAIGRDPAARAEELDPPEFVALAAALAMISAPAPAKINLALVVGADARRRPARGRDDPPAGRALRHGLARAGRRARASTGSRTTRSSGARSRRSRPQRASSRAGARGSRSGSRSRPGSAAAAPTPRPRSGSPASSSTTRRRPSGSAALAARRSASTSRSSSSRARSSAPATARRSSRSTCRRTTRCCSCCRTASSKPLDRRDLRALRRRGGLRRAAARVVLEVARAGRAADLAALPPNDLARSPLAARLRDLGAFRADVSGAGPGRLRPLRRPGRRRARRRGGRSPRRELAHRPCVVAFFLRWLPGADVLDKPDSKPGRYLARAPAAAHALDRGDRGRRSPCSASIPHLAVYVLAIVAIALVGRRSGGSTSRRPPAI